jgi:hypothetical protein
MDSIDTSAILYITARKQYLIGYLFKAVRLVDFSMCDCLGCKYIESEKPHPLSPEFFIHLYLHNVIEAAKTANAYTTNSQNCEEKKASFVSEEKIKKEIPVIKKVTLKDTILNSERDSCWKTAKDLLSSIDI